MRNDFKLSADALRSVTHAHEAVTFSVLRRIKPPAIVSDFQHKPALCDLKGDGSFGAAGVTNHVVYAFLEYQKDLPPNICSEPDVLFFVRLTKTKRYVSRG